jgi:putative Mn2+ efflux pump MntP
VQAFAAAQAGLWIGGKLSEELREGAERLAGLVLIATAIALIALKISGHQL